MKYYTYVSQTKVDMLYDQIPAWNRERISKELKIDLKLISVTLSNASNTDSLFSKLEIVSKYIEKSDQVGTVDTPNSFFLGQMPLRWGPLSIGHHKFVYFSGVTDKTFLGLSGSIKHVIGNPGTSKTTDLMSDIEISDSSAPKIITSLATVLEAEDQDNLPLKRKPSYEIYLVEQMAKKMEGSLQNCTFLARNLMSGKRLDGKQVLLGSPIYVALAQ